ncbi:MAG: YciI family protein [Kofleriaceae bacterium]
MQYLLLIYQNESAWEAMPEADRNTAFAAYMKFTDDIKASGHFKAGEALQPVRTATTVRVRAGKTQTTDGPFAETREQLGGFYLIEAKDLDDATKVAARIPDAAIATGSIEIRPLMVFDQV